MTNPSEKLYDKLPDSCPSCWFNWKHLGAVRETLVVPMANSNNTEKLEFTCDLCGFVIAFDITREVLERLDRE